MLNIDETGECSKGVSICNIHGIKITGLNPSIGPYHTSSDQQENNIPGDVKNTYSENVNINNVVFERLTASVDEELICTEHGAIVHISAGLKATERLISTSIGKELIEGIFKLSKKRELDALIKSTITQNVLNFACNKDNEKGACSFIGSSDSMGHLNKGVLAITYRKYHRS